MQRLFAEHSEEHFDGVAPISMSKLAVSKLHPYAQFSIQSIGGGSMKI